MELCPYLPEEQKLTLKDYENAPGPGYRMSELRSGRLFNEAAFARAPKRGGFDVLVEAS